MCKKIVKILFIISILSFNLYSQNIFDDFVKIYNRDGKTRGKTPGIWRKKFRFHTCFQSAEASPGEAFPFAHARQNKSTCAESFVSARICP